MGAKSLILIISLRLISIVLLAANLSLGCSSHSFLFLESGWCLHLYLLTFTNSTETLVLCLTNLLSGNDLDGFFYICFYMVSVVWGNLIGWRCNVYDLCPPLLSLVPPPAFPFLPSLQTHRLTDYGVMLTVYSWTVQCHCQVVLLQVWTNIIFFMDYWN